MTAYDPAQLPQTMRQLEKHLAHRAASPGTVSCVYCGATGAAGHFEPVNRRDHACKQATLCTLRTVAGQLGQGLADASPAGLVVQLARELAQVARQDNQARYGTGNPGGPDWAEHASTYRPLLADRDRARLHLVLRAASDWLGASGSADSARQLAQARADLGCKRCGAMGPREDCTTEAGTPARDWHAGRKF